MSIAYQFLPWTRRGLAVALDQPDPINANLDARGRINVGVQLAGAHAGAQVDPVPVQLYGPGDVVAIDTALVLRTDPKPGTTNFEPNYLAIVDFDPPDFPWMLTPARASGDDRLRPWLVLVVLDRAKCRKPAFKGQAPLPQIRIPAADVAAELPPLGESWSWAHAQVVSKAAAADVAGIQHDLQKDPASNCSRLVCPRRLEPDKDYVACLVPAFEPGRLRGLGLAGDGRGPAMQTLAPAWDTQAGADVVLPVYHHWEFSTGPRGDFEYLARKLRSPKKWLGNPEITALLATAGTAPMAVDPLLGGGTVTMEGALVPMTYEPGTLAAGDPPGALRTIVNTPADKLNNPVEDEPDGSLRRMEVKPPMWGSWHRRKHSVELDEQGTQWIAGLNLHPRYRGAAGYGAEVVRLNQEAYADACWDQIGDIRSAELKFNLTRLAIEAQRALKAKHFDVLPPERLMQVMGPALSRIEAITAQGQVAYKVNGQIASLGGQVARSSLPAALMDGALRRGASPLRRGLRLASRGTTGGAAALAGLARGYVAQMAAASTRQAALKVNEFMPDGIVGTRLFDGLQFDPAGQREVDLSSRGLRSALPVAQVQAAMAASDTARKLVAKKGVPGLHIRVGQLGGVFTDLHVERFAGLAGRTKGVMAGEFTQLVSTMEAASRRGVEGLLVEAQIDGGALQVSGMQLDKRSGALRLDKPLLRLMPGPAGLRAVRPRAGELARAAGVALGKVDLGNVKTYGNLNLFSNLPPDAFDLQSGAVAGQFKLDAGLQFQRVGDVPPPQRNVASITLPPALKSRDILNRFSRATKDVQTLWRDPFAGTRVAVQVVDFPVSAAAAIVMARTQPEQTLRARLASQVSLGGVAAGGSNGFVAAYLSDDRVIASRQRFLVPLWLDRVMAWPHLRAPMYKALSDWNPEAFMPGVGNLPPDLIMLVRVNQFFLDSFMAGANHEMNRELLWRGFPTDLRGTPFQRFWGREGYDKATGERIDLDDLEPMHLWGSQALGRRVDPNQPDPDRIALIIKGQLLRRYPNAHVYAWRRKTGVPADASKLVKPPGANDIQTPVFSGTLAPDITFFGFEINAGQAKDWCFVVEEPMSEPRFGFDVEDPPPPAAGGSVAIGARPRGALKWAMAEMAKGPAASSEFKAVQARGFNPYKALSWSHVGVAAGAHVSLGALTNPPNLPADAPFAAFPKLVPTATAAEVAKALLQLPFRAYWEGADLSIPPGG